MTRVKNWRSVNLETQRWWVYFSHPKGWVTTWFYFNNTAPTTENPLPGYRAGRLPADFDPPSKIILEEHAEAFPFLSKAKALLELT